MQNHNEKKKTERELNNLLIRLHKNKRNVEQLIKQLLLKLQISYYAFLALPLIIILAGQLDLMSVGLYTTSETQNDAFVLQVTAVLTTLIIVPLSLKLFTLNTKNNLLRYTLDGVVHSYYIWSLVRLGMLELAVCLDIILYYLTLNNMGLLLSCIVYMVMIYCYPSKERIEKFLNDSKENRD